MVIVNMERNINFSLTLRPARSVALKVGVEDMFWLWHKKLGHVNLKA
jgi:hypothetical protein